MTDASDIHANRRALGMETATATTTIPPAAAPMLARIAEIDAMFDAATGWGSWMASLANEREALVETLRKDFGLKVEHKWKARTETGGRTC